MSHKRKSKATQKITKTERKKIRIGSGADCQISRGIFS